MSMKVTNQGCERSIAAAIQPKYARRWTTLNAARSWIHRELGMAPIFNIVMRIVSSLVGVAMILMGTVWMLQGLNLAFRVGFMVGNYHWTIYGAILALVGVAQVVWSNTRQKL
jgi:hypothetical protein